MLERALVGIAQWLPVPGRLEENLDSALGFIQELGEAECDLIVLPELWPSGFDRASLARDLAQAAEPLDGPRTRALADAAAKASAWLAAGSVPERASDGRIYNTALLFSREGELRAVHRKCHLYVPLGEDRATSAGDRLTVCDTGDLGIVGLSVCFDGDFPEVARTLRARGARLVVEPAAYEIAAERWWDLLYPAHALTNGQWWVMANQCGTPGSDTLFGGSRVISPSGEEVASARRAGPGETPNPELLTVEIDLRAEIERADREQSELWEGLRPDLYRDESR